MENERTQLTLEEKEIQYKLKEFRDLKEELDRNEEFLLQRAQENKDRKNELDLMYMDEEDRINEDDEFKVMPEDNQLSVIEERTPKMIKEEFLENCESDKLALEFLQEIDSEELVQEFLKNMDYDEIADAYFEEMKDFEFESNVKKIEYFEEFNIEECSLQDIYVVTKEDKKNKEKIEIFMGNAKNKIIDIDEKDNIKVSKNMEKILDPHDLVKEDIMSNQENLKGYIREATVEEMQDVLSEMDENSKEAKEIKEMKKEKNEEEAKKGNKNQDKAIENDLVESGLPKDLGIMNYKKIIDSRMRAEFPEAVEGTEEVGIVYSTKLNSFIMIAKTDEGYKMANGIEMSKPTMLSVLSIDEDGDTVEKKVPNAMMRTSRSNKELAITMDCYGYFEVEKVDRTPGNNRIANKLESQGEREIVTKETKINTDIKRQTALKMDRLVENYEENLQGGDTVQSYDDLEQNEDWVITLDDGTVIEMEEEARKANVSVEEFIRLYNESEGKDAKEKIENTHDEIEEQYTHRSFNRDREERGMDD